MIWIIGSVVYTIVFLFFLIITIGNSQGKYAFTVREFFECLFWPISLVIVLIQTLKKKIPSKAHIEAIDLYIYFLKIIENSFIINEINYDDPTVAKDLAKQCASFMAGKVFNMQHPSMSTYEYWRNIIDEIKKI